MPAVQQEKVQTFQEFNGPAEHNRLHLGSCHSDPDESHPTNVFDGSPTGTSAVNKGRMRRIGQLVA